MSEWPKWFHHKQHAKAFIGILFVVETKKFNLWRRKMNFALLDNQHGVLVLVAIDANGKSVDSNGNAFGFSNLVGTTSDPTIMTVNLDAGNNSALDVICVGKDGTVNITATATNSAGTQFSTTFTFTVTAPVVDVATGFTATLINVVNN